MANARTISDDRFIKLQPGKIYAKRWIPATLCAAEPIILIHDSLGCVELWRDFPKKLSEKTGRIVIAYDRLGFGRSDPRAEPLPLNFISEESSTCIPAILHSFDLDKFVVFGHSVGGGMAAICAAKFNSRSMGVITESAQAFIEEKTRAGVLTAKEKPNNDDHIGRLIKYHGNKSAWVFHAWIDTWLVPEFASWSLEPDIRAIKCPLLVIDGDRDEYGSQQQAKAVCAHAGGKTRMIIIPDCGHIPHREKQESVLEITAEFITHDVTRSVASAFENRG